jgi:serpin B
MNPTERLLLSFVKQNTFIAVDEQGTEAAAVTTGGVSTTSVQLPILCDRPFVFVIHERTTKTVLFVGKIANPTQSN